MLLSGIYYNRTANLVQIIEYSQFLNAPKLLDYDIHIIGME